MEFCIDKTGMINALKKQNKKNQIPSLMMKKKENTTNQSKQVTQKAVFWSAG